MEIKTYAREVAHWPVKGVDDAQALEASYDQVTWFPLNRATGEAFQMVAGPDATGNPDGTIVLAKGLNVFTIRPSTVTASNELPARPAGTINVVD